MTAHTLHRALGASLTLALLAFTSSADAGVIRDEASPGWCRTTAQSGTILETDDARLDWQGDGNLAIYGDAGLLWSTGVTGANLQLCFQNDGNLVVYGNNGAVWATGSAGGSSARLHLDRCTLSVLDGDGQPVWDSRYRCEPITTAEVQNNWCRTTAESAVLLRTDDAYLAWQGDGNLVLYDDYGAPRWSSGTAGQADRICHQGDGNLVISNASQTVWDTASLGGMGTRLVLDRCTVTLFDGSSIWTTGFACEETYHDEIGTDWCRTTAQSGTILQTEDASLVWQGDGHLVLYDRGSIARWSSGTSGQNNQLCFQSDGNLVVYDGAQPLWSTSTGAGSASRLSLDNCTLSVLHGGQSLWDSGYRCAGSVNADRIEKGWCRSTAQSGNLLQTPYADLAWQGDGNLVLYDRINNVARWTTGTAGQAEHLCFQGDGNLVIYDAQSSALFSTSQYGATGPALLLNGCSLSIDGHSWSVGFACDMQGGIVETHTEADSWSQDGFGAGYTASVSYQQPYAGFSRTVAEAAVTATVFGQSADVVSARASTIYAAGDSTGDGAITVMGVLTPIVFTTEDEHLIPPIEKTFMNIEGSVDIGPITVGPSATIEGRIGITGRLIPELSGASITVTPYAELESKAKGSASKFCLEGGVEGTVKLIDFTMPTTAGLDMVDRVASLVGRIIVSGLSGKLEAYVEYCIGGNRWTLYDFGGLDPLVTTDFVNTSVSF